MNKRLNRKELETLWLHEEEIAHIRGWDFSHIWGKYEEERDLPWDYETMVRRYLGPDMRLLDIDTGGGEFLLSLGHPRKRLAATENYPPNVRLCREKLLPMGIDFREADGNGALPFDDQSFDMVINRHGNFNPGEIGRVLKPGGLLYAPTFVHGKGAGFRLRMRLLSLAGFRVYSPWTAGAFVDYISGCGFEVTKTELLGKSLAPLCYLEAKSTKNEGDRHG